jgi:hypothetical protein
MQIILPVLEIIYIPTTPHTLQINAAFTLKNVGLFVAFF